MSITRRQTLTLLAGTSLAPARALSQGFPTRVIKIVVPYPAGGPTDALARIVAQELSTALGQNAIVENVGGGAGAIGARQVAKAEADGHTLVLSTNQTHATNYILLKDPGYEAKDFAAVAGLADLQHCARRQERPAGEVGRRARPPLQGQSGQAQLRLDGQRLVLASRHGALQDEDRDRDGACAVPRRSADGAGGGRRPRRPVLRHPPSVLGQIQGGNMRALAVASTIRAPQLPDVPLLAEQGVSGGEADAWIGLWAPAATPPAILGKLTAAVTAALAKPEVREAATKLGIAVNLRDPKAFDRFVQDEIKKWGEVVKAANVKMEG